MNATKSKQWTGYTEEQIAFAAVRGFFPAVEAGYSDKTLLISDRGWRVSPILKFGECTGWLRYYFSGDDGFPARQMSRPTFEEAVTGK